jgi:transposase-like protein
VSFCRNNGFPDKVVMDKSGANYAGLANINLLLILAGFATMIDICQVKYLNNIVEQDPCAKIYLCFVSESELLPQWRAHNG